MKVIKKIIKNFKKSQSNVYNNTLVKSHNYCKNYLRDNVFDIKKKYIFLRRNIVPYLFKTNIYNNKKDNLNYKTNNKIYFTEKITKTKNSTNIINQIKKKTPDYHNNITEQNIKIQKNIVNQLQMEIDF